MTENKLQIEYALRRDAFRLTVDLDLPMRGVTALFGPSGAGKTTLLRLVAGLEHPPDGKLLVAGKPWHDAGAGIWRAPHERDVGYVFQEPRLFRHLDVRANLLFGSRRGRGRGNGKSTGFDQVVDLLGLSALLDRPVTGLSGGEAQRVAIGRALLRAPSLVLMDEPLASLDAARRDEILPFLDRLHAELATPILYVSHDLDEVCRLCDHLVVLDAGSVVADGDLQSVLVRMDVPQLAGGEASALVTGEVTAYEDDYELTHIRFPGGEFRVPGRHGAPGTTLRLRIRANDVSLCRGRPEETTILNILPARIDAIDAVGGASELVRLAVGDVRLLARVTRRSIDELGLAAGQSIHAQIKAVAVREP